MKNKKKKNILIAILCCLLVFMGIGYAPLSQILNINSTGSITGEFNIIIDDMQVIQKRTDGAINKEINVPKNTTASYKTEFSKPRDYITYDVTVKNIGTIKGILESVAVIQEPNEDMKADLIERGLTVEDVFETKVYNRGTINDITLGVPIEPNNGTYNFDIRTTYKDVNFIPKGEILVTIEIKYVQLGSGKVNPYGYDVEIDNSPNIIVDSEGTLTYIKKERYTNEDGVLVLPSMTEEGEPIKSLDRSSLADTNIKGIYDSDNFIILADNDEIYNGLLDIIKNPEEDEGSSTSSSSNNFINKKINPTKLFNKETKYNIKRTSSSESSEEEPNTLLCKTEKEDNKKIYLDCINLELKEIKIELEKDGLQYKNGYFDFDEKDIYLDELPPSKVEKLDLSKAIYLETIKEYAFIDSALKEITFNKELKTIEKYAFAYSKLSGKLELPKLITKIEKYAFSGCNIDEVNFSELKKIKEITGFDNTQIQSFTIPDNVTTIGESAFWNCTQLDTINLNNGKLKEIDSYAFFIGNYIDNLIIPNTVTSMSTSSFNYNEVNKLQINNYTSNYRNSAFLIKKINDVYINGDNIDINNNFLCSTGDSAGCSFYSDIKKITIGNGITSIGNSVFRDSNISELALGNSIVSIGDWAFFKNKISYLFIPKNIKYIGEYALGFDNNRHINAIIEDATDLKIERVAMIRLEIQSGVIGKDSINGYFDEIEIGNKVSEIGSNAFDHSNILRLIINEGVKSIGDNAFKDNQIKELTIPNSITSLGNSAFSNNEFEKLTIKNMKDDINYTNVFLDANISTLIVNSGIIKDIINDYEKLVVGKDVTSITGTFKTLKNIDLSNATSLMSITGLFNESTIETLDLSKATSLTTIGDNSFAGAGIYHLILGNKITTIGKNAFGKYDAFPWHPDKGKYYNYLEDITIKMSKDDFENNVSIGEKWYEGTPNIIYESS